MENALIRKARETYSVQDAPLLSELTAQMRESRPYAGLRVLYNLPLFTTNLLSLESLLASGAELTITKARFVDSDPEILELIRSSSIPFFDAHEDIAGEFDVFLDCCAELGSRLTPQLGAVEITQTGAQRYRKMAPTYPVISVDDSSVKRLEDSLGSADGFMRALAKLTPRSVRGENVLIFGYGKVGIGLADRITRAGARVTVVDLEPAALSRARTNGLRAISLGDRDAVERAIAEAAFVVTATGSAGFVSRCFDASLFHNKILANVGAEDEFGPAIPSTMALFGKKPVNFSLKEPTTVPYLDPAFYAHNTSIALLQSGKFAAGVHPLPAEIDRHILGRWFGFHGDSLGNFEALYGASYVSRR